ncbi:HesA/MoeB/ThiF family protein [Methanocella conradii]|uniref:HesA/MoeB/ThiF family protein n=1 Tax=Methanocella conradii TaxID=1175444 RepID=UPI0024B3AEA5|nr:HesA/MoeB/ThiF family protein [Methanocella conradii]MDI6895948.1 HesA/MoeB/ThiF family protein [Methanocella conradii]
MTHERDLTDYDLVRYDRQIMLRGIGEEGQMKLKGTRVFVAGCGGLGSPVAYYLAAAGFGSLVLADMDIVDLSNLNRQILHWDSNIGEKKVKSAYEKLAQLNPEIEVNPLDMEINEFNVYEVTKGCDVIVDCLDNFEARYLLNRASLKHGIPFIHASIWGMEGRVTTFVPGKTPCLECIFPKAPPQEKFPVLGATAGVLGAIQVTEAAKVVLGIGEPLLSRLLVYDGEYMQFHEVRLERNPECPACRI